VVWVLSDPPEDGVRSFKVRPPLPRFAGRCALRHMEGTRPSEPLSERDLTPMIQSGSPCGSLVFVHGHLSFHSSSVLVLLFFEAPTTPQPDNPFSSSLIVGGFEALGLFPVYSVMPGFPATDSSQAFCTSSALSAGLPAPREGTR